MKVDIRFPELDMFLQRWRARLNRRWLAGEVLAALAAAGTAALPLAWFLPQGLLWWSLATATASLGFAVWKLPRKLSPYRAAAWLDERCGTQGLFGAAVVCLDSEDTFGTKVLGAADTARTKASPRLPWQRLGLRAALAAAAASCALLSFEAPSVLPGHAAATSEAPAAVPTPTAPPTGTPRELKPGDAARKLFPENPRLAALAEQALTDGGEDALRALLEQAQDAQSLPGTGQRSGRPRQPGPGADQSPDAQPGEPGDPKGDQSPRAGGQASPRPNDKPGAGGPTGKGQDKNRGSSGSDQGQGDSGGGRDPGKGHSTTPLGQAPQGSASPPLVLKEPSTAGLFEFALPGSGPRLPSADTVAAARRSAESQVARAQPPLEFQSTIRDYFLSLNQEVLP